MKHFCNNTHNSNITSVIILLKLTYKGDLNQSVRFQCYRTLLKCETIVTIFIMPKEGRFYVEYMGWKETRGLYGSEFTDPIVSKLLARHRATKHPHRMTIKINRDELQISQEKSGSSKSQKIKYPAQPMCDVSYVSQCAPPNTDVVCCIFLGYNMYTQCAAHVHAYRFDSPDTATIFVKLVNSYIEQSEYRQRILAMERDLAELGHVSNSRTVSATNGNMPLSINPDMGSDGGSYGSHSPNSSDSGLPRSYGTAEEALKQRKDIVIKRTPSQKKQQPTSKLFSNIQDELAHKLSLQQEKEAAILLPPKDYDTIVRRHGHLSIRSKVVTKTQPSIMGAGNIFENKAARASAEDNNNKSTRQVCDHIGQVSSYYTYTR